jgi:hypothetical protein
MRRLGVSLILLAAILGVPAPTSADGGHIRNGLCRSGSFNPSHRYQLNRQTEPLKNRHSDQQSQIRQTTDSGVPSVPG